MSKMETKRPIPVPAEKALKSFYSFLSAVKEEHVGGSIASKATRTGDSTARIREKRIKMLDQFKAIAEVLPKCLKFGCVENSREQELVELVKAAEGDMNKDYTAAEARWVDLLLDKVTDILDSTQHINLEKLTMLMEKNDNAGNIMEGKDVILLLGSPGCGKTTTMHYLAGTSFREIAREGVSFFKPVDVADPSMADKRVSYGGKEVITRHLQVSTVSLNRGPVVLCDTPSFGDHETIEEVIANSLGLVRALQKARTVRPVLVLSRDEIGFRDQFNAYPQILSILVRMLGTDSNVNLKPFNFVFTKYDTQSKNSLRRQFSKFLKDGEITGSTNEANKQAIIKHLMNHANPDAHVIVPTKGDPCDFLDKLMSTDCVVENPESFFVPNLSEAMLSVMKRQLKFTLLDLRDALSKNDNSVAIHRMQQMSKLANLLPEAGIYARHGFKAFKEIINQMVEEEEDDDDEYFGDDDYDDGILSHSSNEELKFSDSRESWASSESEQWSNVSSKIVKSNSNEVLVSRHLSTVLEEGESEMHEKESEVEITSMENKQESPPSPVKSGPSEEFLKLANEWAAKDTIEQDDIGAEQVEAKHTRPTAEGDAGAEQLELNPVLSSEPEEEGEEVQRAESNASVPSEEYSREEGNDVMIYLEGQDEDSNLSSHEQAALEDHLPEEDMEYANDYSSQLREMTIKAVEQEDYGLAQKRMQEFTRLIKATPEQVGENEDFALCVELFLKFSTSLRECDYRQCLSYMEKLYAMGDAGIMEAQKCSECCANAAINHIIELRERVVVMTSQLHSIDDPDEFDRLSESLRVLRRKVEKSNMLVETCMKGSNDKNKSEAVLACISYGFRTGRMSR